MATCGYCAETNKGNSINMKTVKILKRGLSEKDHAYLEKLCATQDSRVYELSIQAFEDYRKLKPSESEYAQDTLSYLMRRTSVVVGTGVDPAIEALLTLSSVRASEAVDSIAQHLEQLQRQVERSAARAKALAVEMIKLNETIADIEIESNVEAEEGKINQGLSYVSVQRALMPRLYRNQER